MIKNVKVPALVNSNVSGSIERAAEIDKLNWTDGICGFNEGIVFTSAEFDSFDVAASLPVYTGINISAPPRHNVLVTDVAGKGGLDINAVKILPKGFTVNIGQNFRISAIDGAAWSNKFSTIEVFAYDSRVLDSGQSYSLMGGTPVPIDPGSWSGNGIYSDIAATDRSPVGNGDVLICVRIHIDAGFSMTALNGLAAVYVPIIRA